MRQLSDLVDRLESSDIVERERERVRREERINTGITSLLFEKPQKRIRYYKY